MQSLQLLGDYTANIDKTYKFKAEESINTGYQTIHEGFRLSDDLHVHIHNCDNMDQKYFLRYAELLLSIHHPGCQSLVALSLRPKFTIVTKYISDVTLLDTLVKTYDDINAVSQFTPTKRMCCIYRLCSIMEFLHSHKIMIRDFKPLTIFLNDDYEPILTDFSFSRNNDLNLTLSSIRTPLYTAPELFTDEYESYTDSIDVYSFGVTYLQFFGKINILDDGKGKIKSPQNLMMRISKGAKIAKPERMTQAQYDIYLNCASTFPYKRPSFSSLAQRFELDESVWIDGIDEQEFKKYIEKCKNENKSSWVH